MVCYNKNVKKYLEDHNMHASKIGIRQHCRRMKKLLWYVPVYVLRNWRKDREVPLYVGKEFSTLPTAKKALFCYYIRRL